MDTGRVGYAVKHKMKLFAEPFERMKNGEKTIEVRLNDEKRQLLQVGDSITFYKLPEETEVVIVTVLELLPYKNFEELYSSTPFTAFGCAGRSMAWMLERTYAIYTPEQEAAYGALGIRIRVE